jgi:hypothetical protein
MMKRSAPPAFGVDFTANWWRADYPDMCEYGLCLRSRHRFGVSWCGSAGAAMGVIVCTADTISSHLPKRDWRVTLPWRCSLPPSCSAR